ncbi:CLUMA_CG017794, isoform A [Clunio marinus]|uniref:CLUMA_CG017794, isoform A n=1 Tax=Clunio marinus TaxID=568069 RepID=A0A1J1IZY4_9DIPT|nr:CLUMA_CG017794, isoform A [Clunio marinus]
MDNQQITSFATKHLPSFHGLNKKLIAFNANVMNILYWHFVLAFRQAQRLLLRTKYNKKKSYFMLNINNNNFTHA